MIDAMSFYQPNSIVKTLQWTKNIKKKNRRKKHYSLYHFNANT